MDKITKNLLNDFSVRHDMNRLDESTQFEHFVNYSIISKLNRSSFELSDIHTGNGGDCAIDGICLVVNGKIITDIDELKEIVDNSCYLDADIAFIQSKTTSSFSGSEVGSFIFGVKDFLSDDSQLVQNDRIKSIKLIWEEVISMSRHMVNRRPCCRLFYVCTGQWVNDQNLQAIINNGKKEIASLSLFEEVSITPNGASEIGRLYQETKNRLSTTINFQNKITLPDIEGVTQSYLGLVQFDEFIKLIQDDNQVIHNIFDDNVRDFQGENDVNKKIKETLSSKKFDLFCILNNGVTVVSSSLTAAGNKFTLRDYQIVNGCQTSHVLHECREIADIQKVNVPIKIIVTESDDIKTEITLATNSQTAIKTEQLASLNKFQRTLEDYFNSEADGIRLYYERRSQQYNSSDRIKNVQIITIPIQIKSFASMFLESPHLVSGYYGTVVKRFSGEIFVSNHKCAAYFVSALCYFRIEQFFRSCELSSEYKKARFHIMMIIKIIHIGTERINSNKFEQKCESLKKELMDDAKALAIFKNSINIFKTSGIDLTKNRYKLESETEMLREAAEEFKKTL